MMRCFTQVASVLLGLLLPCSIWAQTSLRGQVIDAENNTPILDASVVVSGRGKVAATGPGGSFNIPDLAPGSYLLITTANGYLPNEQTVTVGMGTGNVLIPMRRDGTNAASGELPTITLEEAESGTEGAGEVANLLHASRDIFQTMAGFGWSTFRFRERGYDSEFFPLLLNGVSINDPETGIAFFGELGGLNDVLRNRETTVGMEAAEFVYSEIGGATRLDTRASIQRQQMRASYAVSNRTYRNRAMFTASSGLLPNGWAATISGSRRWAQEGYFEGTPFDAYSYFLSIDKKWRKHNLLNLTVLGAPTVRGRNGDTFQEMYDLAGTTRYNPFWGYQNGEKRNASMQHSHQPMALLRYDFGDTETSVTVSAYGQAGQRGETRLDWFKANNPLPDYNRRLPSALQNAAESAAWAEQLRTNPALRQIDWDGLYSANRLNDWTIQNADGIAGNTITGKRSQTVLADFRSDSREAGINAVVRQSISKRTTLHGGLHGQWYVGQNFKNVADLLGGDFIVDYDRFAQQQVPDNPLAQVNDLRTPNDIVRTGETYGFNYDENIRRGGGWMQVQTNLRKISLFAGGELAVVQMWRTGRMQNGRFTDNSLGDSKHFSFPTYSTKAGITYKLNGRNYFYANGLYGTRAPLFRDIFLSPRTRNEVVDNVNPYHVESVEGGYQLRAPYLRARVTGYLTRIKGEIEAFQIFQPSVGVFGTNLLQGINRQHAGTELALEAKPIVGWTFSAAANLGKYIYTNRPTQILTLDNTAERIIDGVTVYQKNFFVPRTPQTTASASVKYESKRFWFAALTFNFADNLWYQFDYTRRTAGFVENFEPGSELWNIALDQRKAPAAYTLDFFGGKSWRLRDKYFLYLNAGLNNLLNNRNIIIAGRDAYRNAYANDPTDIRLYTQELTYAPGFNYFISLAVRR